MKNLTTDYLISPHSVVDEFYLINNRGCCTPWQFAVGVIEKFLKTISLPILTDHSVLSRTGSTFPLPDRSSLLKFCSNQRSNLPQKNYETSINWLNYCSGKWTYLFLPRGSFCYTIKRWEIVEMKKDDEK